MTYSPNPDGQPLLNGKRETIFARLVESGLDTERLDTAEYGKFADYAEEKSGSQIVRPFHPTHGKILSNLSDQILHIYVTNGLGWTAFVDNRPIASAGIVIMAPGMGHCWGMISDEARRFPVLLHKNVKKHLEEIIKEYSLRRVDYIVDPIKPTAITWAKRLGFEFEGEMRAFYVDGHSAHMYARVNL